MGHGGSPSRVVGRADGTDGTNGTDGTVGAPGFRPAFHFTPERGRLNDPNGLIRVDGGPTPLWHVFYQLDPDFPAGPPRTGWGYATSPDLLTWRHRPQALFPDDDYDADGCFSGGAVAPQAAGGPVELFYTGNLPAPDDVPARVAVPVGHVWGATQNVAVAEVLSDGSLGPPVKLDANPLIPGPPVGVTAHYRDPIVTADPGRPGMWRMILGARTDDDRGTMVLHLSRDRRTWDAGRELLIDGPSPGGYMWECPGLLRMTDGATGEEADVLILSPQGIRAESGDELRNRYQCGYLVGRLNNPGPGIAAGSPVFRVTTPFTELDRGFEFYAPQVFAGADADAPVLLGWMGMPEEDDHPSTAAEGWLHCLSLARRLRLYDGHLHQSPVLPPGKAPANGDSGVALPTVGDGHVGDVFRVRLGGDGTIELRGAERASVTVSLAGDRLSVVRRNVGVPDHFGDERATTLRPTHQATRQASESAESAEGRDSAEGRGKGHDGGTVCHHIDVIVDRSAMEIIADDGAAIFSLRAFSPDGCWTLQLT